MKESRLTDCLRILTGFGKESLRIFFFTDFLRGEGEQAYGLLTDSYRIWERSLRKLTDFLRGEGEQAYGLLTDSYRIWKRKFTDFLRIFFYGFFTG